MRLSLLSFSIILLAASSVVHAKMYKWVDENGQMHFGDKIPPKYLVKEHQELNEQGVVTRNLEAAKTAEEREEEKRLEVERKKKELAEKKQKQRDRVLLDTYTTERDLIVARDSRLEAVDSQIKLSDQIIQDSNKKIATLEKQIADIQATNRNVPDDLYKRIDNMQSQVKVQQSVMKSHQKHRGEISGQFNGYIERFKVLKAEQKAKRERLAKERGL